MTYLKVGVMAAIIGFAYGAFSYIGNDCAWRLIRKHEVAKKKDAMAKTNEKKEVVEEGEDDWVL